MTPKPTFPALEHAVLEALSLVPEATLHARVEHGVGLLSDVCEAELARRAAVTTVSAVTEAEGAFMITTLERLRGNELSSSRALELWGELNSTERLHVIRVSRAHETDPHFRVRVHVLHYGAPLCGKPGIPGRWCDGDSWVNLHNKAEATCEPCVSRASKENL